MCKAAESTSKVKMMKAPRIPMSKGTISEASLRQNCNYFAEIISSS